MLDSEAAFDFRSVEHGVRAGTAATRPCAGSSVVGPGLGGEFEGGGFAVADGDAGGVDG